MRAGLSQIFKTSLLWAGTNIAPFIVSCLLSAGREHSTYSSPFYSFQLRAYEQGMCARLNQTDFDLRALRCERHDALRGLNASKDQTQVWVVWWKRIAIF